MRRPTIKQFEDVRLVMGNGYGDGDYIQGMDKNEARKINRSIHAFETWLEKIGNFKYKMYTAQGGK